jgi:hypothetical protein
MFVEEFLEKQCGSSPQRADSPFPALAIKMYERLGIQSQVLPPKLRDLLHSRSRIVEEQQEGTIS